MNRENLTFRPAAITDFDSIWEVIEDGRAALKALGIDQWQGVSPSREMLEADIADGRGYVAVDDGQVVGYIMLTDNGEPIYDEIADGAWLTVSTSADPRYLAAHRVAVRASAKGEGVGKFMLAQAQDVARERELDSVRIDTHEGNIVMRGLLQSLGYTECGIIMLEPNGLEFTRERVAYEKKVDPMKEEIPNAEADVKAEAAADADADTVTKAEMDGKDSKDGRDGNDNDYAPSWQLSKNRRRVRNIVSAILAVVIGVGAVAFGYWGYSSTSNGSAEIHWVSTPGYVPTGYTLPQQGTSCTFELDEHGAITAAMLATPEGETRVEFEINSFGLPEKAAWGDETAVLDTKTIPVVGSGDLVARGSFDISESADRQPAGAQPTDDQSTSAQTPLLEFRADLSRDPQYDSDAMVGIGSRQTELYYNSDGMLTGVIEGQITDFVQEGVGDNVTDMDRNVSFDYVTDDQGLPVRAERMNFDLASDGVFIGTDLDDLRDAFELRYDDAGNLVDWVDDSGNVVKHITYSLVEQPYEVMTEIAPMIVKNLEMPTPIMLWWPF